MKQGCKQGMKQFISSLKMIALTGVLISGVFLFLIQVAHAQDKCSVAKESIVDLRAPVYGYPTIWNNLYTHEGQSTQIKAGLPSKDQNVIILGRNMMPDGETVDKIFIAEMTQRGRPLAEGVFAAKPSEDPVGILPIGEGYVVLSNIKIGEEKMRWAVRLSWYDDAFQYISDNIVQDPEFDYHAAYITKPSEGDGFLVVVNAQSSSEGKQSNRDVKEHYGRFLRYDSKGTKMWDRSYRVGIANKMFKAIVIPDEGYLAIGQIELDDGRQAAWTLKTSTKGSILEQSTFPRGVGSVIYDGLFFPENRLTNQPRKILVGKSTPFGEGKDAAWIVAVNTLGETIWQRYFRNEDYNFAARYIHSAKDGQLTLGVNATGTGKTGNNNHVRYFILSSGGVFNKDEGYRQGINAKATDFFPGLDGERIVTGIVEGLPGEQFNEEVETFFLSERKIRNEAGIVEEVKTVVRSLGDVLGTKEDDKAVTAANKQAVVEKGWIFLATPLPPAQDACK